MLFVYVFDLFALVLCDLRPTNSVEDSTYPSATDVWRVRRRHHNGPVVARGGTCDDTYYCGVNRNGAGMYGEANLVSLIDRQFFSWFVVVLVGSRAMWHAFCRHPAVSINAMYC